MRTHFVALGAFALAVVCSASLGIASGVEDVAVHVRTSNGIKILVEGVDTRGELFAGMGAGGLLTTVHGCAVLQDEGTGKHTGVVWPTGTRVGTIGAIASIDSRLGEFPFGFQAVGGGVFGGAKQLDIPADVEAACPAKKYLIVTELATRRRDGNRRERQVQPMTSAVVREWHSDEGWGVVDSDQTPGGCWVHFGDVDMTGYQQLTAGEHVALKWERFNQDGFKYRALRVVPASELAWHAYPPNGSGGEEEPFEPPPDGSVIRLMGDYGVGMPLWGPEGLMFNDANEVVREFGVSSGLAEDLQRWAGAWETQSGKPENDAEARRLSDRLNAELGHRYRFVYRR